MLKDNGHEYKNRRNYHMSIDELKDLLGHIKENYGSQWYLAILMQFSLGLRASEMLAIQIWDFKDKYRKLDYRCAKTNKMVYDEPIPEPLRLLIIAYISKNLHRLMDGYIFPAYSKKGNHMTTKSYGDRWTKWRQTISKKNPRFLDRYKIKKGYRYRISSHSLRRLHRTILRNNINDLYIVKELCNYSDYKVLENYINQQEILEKKSDYLLPIFNPIVGQLSNFFEGQKQLTSFN